MKTIAAVLIILAAFCGHALGCATADMLSSLNRQGINSLPFMNRPETQCDWVTPDGRFHFHYDTTGQNAIYHPYEDIAPVDDIPDYLNRAADYLALSYSAYIQQLGFDSPPSDGINGGDSLYDVYFTDITGMTTPEDLSSQYPGRNAYTSYIQLGCDLRYPDRYGDDPLPFLKANIAHEYFHAIEFAYRVFSNDLTPWWFESCANWGEERVFDDLNDVFYQLPAYMEHTEKSLYMTSGEFYYGAWLFIKYLDERFGPLVVRECWENYIDFSFAVTAIDFALQGHGVNFNQEYCRHAAWNYLTGPNYHEAYYIEGESFGTTVIEAKVHDEYPVAWMREPLASENIATSYVVFKNNGVERGDLDIVYSNETSQLHAVATMAIGLDGSIDYQMHDIQSNVPETFIFNHFNLDDRVVMMPVWLFEGFPKPGTLSYTYKAFIDTTSTGISGDKGLPDRYVLNQAYPNPFNSAVSISFDAPESRPYRLLIYDVGGRLLYSDQAQSNPGLNIIDWHAPEDQASGPLYFIINFAETSLSGRMLFVK